MITVQVLIEFSLPRDVHLIRFEKMHLTQIQGLTVNWRAINLYIKSYYRYKAYYFFCSLHFRQKKTIIIRAIPPHEQNINVNVKFINKLQLNINTDS